jgi:hypothetical protein
MNVVALNADVSAGQLKQYADVICFSQVGLRDAEISARLDLPEYLVARWIKNWSDIEAAARAV